MVHHRSLTVSSGWVHDCFVEKSSCCLWEKNKLSWSSCIHTFPFSFHFLGCQDAYDENWHATPVFLTELNNFYCLSLFKVKLWNCMLAYWKYHWQITFLWNIKGIIIYIDTEVFNLTISLTSLFWSLLLKNFRIRT